MPLVITVTRFILLFWSVKCQSCRDTETWAWLSRMADSGRRCPFKNWHRLVSFGMREAVLSLSLLQCQAQLSSRTRERSSPKGCSKIIS